VSESHDEICAVLLPRVGRNRGEKEEQARRIRWKATTKRKVRGSGTPEGVGSRPRGGNRKGLGLHLFHLILLEFAVKRGFSDAEHAGGGELVSSSLA
jgi:hypothetical protein